MSVHWWGGGNERERERGLICNRSPAAVITTAALAVLAHTQSVISTEHRLPFWAFCQRLNSLQTQTEDRTPQSATNCAHTETVVQFEFVLIRQMANWSHYRVGHCYQRLPADCTPCLGRFKTHSNYLLSDSGASRKREHWIAVCFLPLSFLLPLSSVDQ